MIKQCYATDFILHDFEGEAGRLLKLRRHCYYTTVLGGLVVPSVMVGFGGSTLVGILTIGMSIYGLHSIWKMISHLNSQIRANSHRIERAKELLKFYISYEYKAGVSYNAIAGWLETNQISVHLAEENDPVFGYYGCVISFASSDDLAHFKLRWG